MGDRFSRIDTLLTKLRYSGLDIPEGSTLRTTRRSTVNPADDDWSWKASGPDGTALGIVSAWTVTTLSKVKSFDISRENGVSVISPSSADIKRLYKAGRTR